MWNERFTDIVAAGMASSLVWAPWLTQIHQSVLLPAATILGIIWLLVQLYYKIFKNK